MSGIQVATGMITAPNRANEAVKSYESKCRRLEQLMARVADMQELVDMHVKSAEYHKAASLALKHWTEDVHIANEALAEEKKEFLKRAGIVTIMCIVMSAIAILTVMTRAESLEKILSKVRDMD